MKLTVRSCAYLLSLVFIFMIPWEGMVRLGGTLNVAKLVGLSLAILWVATVVLRGRFRKPGAFHIALSLFVFWNAVSILWSADAFKTLLHALTWTQLFGMVLILWDLYTTRSALLTGLQAYVAGAYVALGSALTNYFSGDMYYTHYERFSSGGASPDGFGLTVALGIPVAWYLTGSNGTGRASRLWTLLNYGYIPAALLGIALSGTRTAFIAAIPGMAFGLASLGRIRPAGRFAIIALLTAAVGALLPQVQTMRSFQRLGTTTTELTEGDLNNRTNNWREGLATFTENPLVGIGGNMYRSATSLGKLAHNSFISVLVELGLVGFVLFGIILMIAVIQALDQPKWDSRFWLTTLFVWSLGASTLSWEFRKSTWLFLSLVIVSAALARQRVETDRKLAILEG